MGSEGDRDRATAERDGAGSGDITDGPARKADDDARKQTTGQGQDGQPLRGRGEGGQIQSGGGQEGAQTSPQGQRQSPGGVPDPEDGLRDPPPGPGDPDEAISSGGTGLPPR